MLRAGPPPAAGREGLDISAVIHDPDAKTQPGDETRSCQYTDHQFLPRTHTERFPTPALP
jgi:hypothetical protein